jgi:hypothetical protein
MSSFKNLHKIKYKLYADIVLIFHVIFNSWFVVGAIYSIYNPWFAIVQCVFVFSTILAVILMRGYCPITLLEIHYRKLHDQKYNYKNKSFWSHHFFGNFFNIDISMRGVDIFLIITKVLPNIIPVFIVYKLFFQ